MGEQVDRRGLIRHLRRSPTAADPEVPEPEREPTPRQRQIQEMAEFTSRLLAGVASEDEERLSDGPLLTKAYDQAYMRVTAGHIVSSVVTGFSALIATADVTAFDTEPAGDGRGHGDLVNGVLHAHHPADLPTVTRSHSYLFPAESPLPAAIRTACGLPEPESVQTQAPEAEAANGE